MKKALSLAIVSTIVVSIGCGDRDGLRRDQQQYEVIQEGAGGAVTGTIAAPGETVPPLMPGLTGTNADTTSAFTLPTGTAATDPSLTPGTIAGSLPVETYDPGQRRVPPRTAPTTPQPERQPDPGTAQRPRESQPAPQPPPTTSDTRAPAPPPEPPTQTDTAPREEPSRPEQERPPQPSPAPPPPPPPPPTDTGTDGGTPDGTRGSTDTGDAPDQGSEPDGR